MDGRVLHCCTRHCSFHTLHKMQTALSDTVVPAIFGAAISLRSTPGEWLFFTRVYSVRGYLAEAHGWGQEGHTSGRTGVRRAPLLVGLGSRGPNFWPDWGAGGPHLWPDRGLEGHTISRTGLQRSILLAGLGSGGPHFWQDWDSEGYTSGRAVVRRATLLAGPGSGGPHF